jgi:hypothetical protein
MCSTSERNPDEPIQTRQPVRRIPVNKTVSLRTRKRCCLLGLLALFFVAGAISPVVPENTHAARCIAYPLAFAATVITLLWCKYDGDERGYRIKPLLGLCIILVAFVGVPFYLLHTRRWRGLVSIVLMVLLIAVCVLASMLGAAVASLVAGMPLS